MQKNTHSDLTSTHESSTNDSVQVVFMTHKKKVHDKFTNDNLLRKLKSNFMNSLIKFLNKLIRAKCGTQRMTVRKLRKEINGCSNKDYNNKLFKRTLINIFNEELSSKYTIIPEDQNTKNLGRICKAPMFNTLLNYTYEEVFKKFYLQNEGNDVYDLLYELEKQANVLKRLHTIRMQTFKEFVKKYENDKQYYEALNNFGPRIFEYLKLHN